MATDYANDVAPLRTTLVALSSLQLAAFDDHFAGDEEQQRIASEHFGRATCSTRADQATKPT